jgi:hypothetical protein
MVGLRLIIPPSAFCAAGGLRAAREGIMMKDILATIGVVASLLMPLLAGAAIGSPVRPAPAVLGPEQDGIVVSLRPSPEAVCMMADRLRCPVQTPIAACPSRRVV